VLLCPGTLHPALFVYEFKAININWIAGVPPPEIEARIIALVLSAIVPNINKNYYFLERRVIALRSPDSPQTGEGCGMDY